MTEGNGPGDRPHVTWDSFVELGKPPGLAVTPSAAAGTGDVYVCSAYALGQPFIMPGNVVGRCSSCGGRVQMRPHAPASPRKVCLPCALSLGLVPPDLGRAARPTPHVRPARRR